MPPTSPMSYGREEWPSIVRSMRAQAGLTAEEEKLLVEYLTELAREGEGILAVNPWEALSQPLHRTPSFISFRPAFSPVDLSTGWGSSP